MNRKQKTKKNEEFGKRSFELESVVKGMVRILSRISLRNIC